MHTLNRFPLLALWAREAALRIGYPAAEADVLGHAYAVLYAIRANSPIRPGKYKDKAAEAAAQRVKDEAPEITTLEFGDDELQISRTSEGVLVGRVGNAEPQTPQSYRYKVVSKYPAGYYDRLQKAFHAYFEAFTPEKLNTKRIYGLYDQWKKQCAAGRLVDLDKLLEWCEKRKPVAEPAPAGQSPSL